MLARWKHKPEQESYDKLLVAQSCGELSIKRDKIIVWIIPLVIHNVFKQRGMVPNNLGKAGTKDLVSKAHGVIRVRILVECHLGVLLSQFFAYLYGILPSFPLP